MSNVTTGGVTVNPQADRSVIRTLSDHNTDQIELKWNEEGRYYYDDAGL